MMSYLAKWYQSKSEHISKAVLPACASTFTAGLNLPLSANPFSGTDTLPSTQLSTSTTLHQAVLQNNPEVIINLLQHGADIHAVDDLNASALHVAVALGKEAAISALLDHGADATTYCHDNCSLIELALLQGEPAVLDALLTGISNETAEVLITKEVLAHGLFDVLIAAEKALDTHQYQLLEMKLHNLILLCQHCQGPLVVEVDENLGLPSDESIPLLLQSIATLAEDTQVAKMIEDTASLLLPQDGTAAHFLAAKNLLHIMALSGLYELTVDTKSGPASIYIDAEGSMPIFTVPKALTQIQKFKSTIGNGYHLKQDAFEYITKVYDKTCDFVSQQGLMSTAEEAYAQLQQGECILLPSGWEGHYMCIIIDPKSQQFILANAGQRYSQFEAGCYIFEMQHPENIDAALIYDIMNSEDQLQIEFVLNYELGLVPVDFLPGTAQTVGNCAWQANECAIEGLLYLHLNDVLHDVEAAKMLAHEYYMEWDQAQTFAALQEYFDGEPRLESGVIVDILTEGLPSLFDECLPIDEHEMACAEYLISVMSEEPYQDDYSELYLALFEAKPEVMAVVESYEPQVILPATAESILSLEDIITSQTDYITDMLDTATPTPMSNGIESVIDTAPLYHDPLHDAFIFTDTGVVM